MEESRRHFPELQDGELSEADPPEVLEIFHEIEDIIPSRSTPIPPLHETVLRILALYVAAVSGMKGLWTFRQVSSLWSRVGTDVFNNQDFTIILEGHSDKDRSWWPEKFLNLNTFNYEGSQLSRPCFRNMILRELNGKDLMYLSLQQPWTSAITQLILWESEVLDWTSMLENIVSGIPKLNSLEISSPLEWVYSRYRETNRMISDTDDSELSISKKITTNTCLRRFTLEVMEYSELERHCNFSWNFLLYCPNLEEIALKFREDEGHNPFQDLSIISSQLKRLSPKLKRIEINWDIMEMLAQLVVTPDIVELLQSFTPSTFSARFKVRGLQDFSERLSVDLSSKIENLFLHIDNRDLLSRRQANPFHVIFNLISSSRFTNLKVLHLILNESLFVFDTHLVDISVLVNLIEFKICPDIFADKSMLVDNARSGIRHIYSYISNVFPNLQVFHGSVIGAEECRLLLVELGKLANLRKVTLKNYCGCRIELRDALFGTADYSGLAGLSNLEDFCWIENSDPTPHIRRLAEFFAKGRFPPAMKRLRIDGMPQISLNPLKRLTEKGIQVLILQGYSGGWESEYYIPLRDMIQGANSHLSDFIHMD